MKNNPVLINEMYDLEQRIMECWELVNDVNLLYEQVMDKDLHKDQDKLANALLGLHTIYEMKFDRAFNTYKKVFHQQLKIDELKPNKNARPQQGGGNINKTYKTEEIFTDIEGDPDNVLMTIPPEIIEYLGLKEGAAVDVTTQGNSLRLKKK